MKRCFALLLCAVALAAFTVREAQADEIHIDLEYGSGTWELYAEVVSTGGADGSLGISAIRALIDNVDFGTNGDGVTIASGLGAINPIDAGGPNERDPVLQMGGGTLDIIYGQDISATGTIVGGVGVGGRDLIMSGTYSGADPAFGSDGSLTTQGLFLTSTTPGGGNAIDPDDNVLTLVPPMGGIPGDFSGSGAVGNDDLTLLLDNWGATVPPVPAGWNNDAPTAPAVGNDDLTRLLDNWGNTALSAASVPEPTTMAIALLASVGCMTLRRRS